jgi:hypothetical protein
LESCQRELDDFQAELEEVRSAVAVGEVESWRLAQLRNRAANLGQDWAKQLSQDTRSDLTQLKKAAIHLATTARAAMARDTIQAWSDAHLGKKDRLEDGLNDLLHAERKLTQGTRSSVRQGCRGPSASTATSSVGARVCAS